MLRNFLLTILLLAGFNILQSQQYPIYSQYVLNEFLINPSVAGIDGMTTLSITGRKQWIGFQHTPETYSACVSTRILKTPFKALKGKIKESGKGRVGLGASFVNDKNGAIKRTSFQITYAYHIFVRNSQLSFGLSGNTTQFKIDENLAEFKDEDPMQGVIGKSAYIPDASAGVNWSGEVYNLGFSLCNIFQSPVKFGEISVQPKELRNLRQYTLYGFYRTDIKRKSDWEFEPSFLIRASENLQISSDITARFIYNREYWAGVSFRTSGEFILLLGLKMNRILFGYSFDYGYNEISKLTYGSHEVSMAIKFGDNTRRYRWLERY
jgi:type IX secretion system PorP/SprF family membrane protein